MKEKTQGSGPFPYQWGSGVSVGRHVVGPEKDEDGKVGGFEGTQRGDVCRGTGERRP